MSDRFSQWKTLLFSNGSPKTPTPIPLNQVKKTTTNFATSQYCLCLFHIIFKIPPRSISPAAVVLASRCILNSLFVLRNGMVYWSNSFSACTCSKVWVALSSVAQLQPRRYAYALKGRSFRRTRESFPHIPNYFNPSQLSVRSRNQVQWTVQGLPKYKVINLEICYGR